MVVLRRLCSSSAMPRIAARQHLAVAHASGRRSTSAGAGATRKRRAGEAQPATTREFHDYFEAQFGARWGALYAALASPTRHVALLNPFLLPGALSAAVEQGLPGALPLPPRLEPWRGRGAALTALQLELAEDGKYPPPFRDAASGLLPWYWLDWASLVPPLALGGPGLAVLDMCAAPGGKSLVLAQLLFGDRGWAEGTTAVGVSQEGGLRAAAAAAALPPLGCLVCNELDPGRRRRLVGVLRDYVPAGARQHIRVTPHDGGAFWRVNEGEVYDRVLLDAPCSSDRHIVQQAAARAGAGAGALGEITKTDWSARRCRAIAGDQAKLLAAAFRALKPGGRLVYSTCSIAEVENDEVVAKLLQRAGAAVAVVSHTLGEQPAPDEGVGPAGGGMGSGGATTATAGAAAGREFLAAADLEALGAARTRHGWLLLPDKPAVAGEVVDGPTAAAAAAAGAGTGAGAGWGPMYVCVLEKRASSDLQRVKVNKYARVSSGDSQCAREE